MVPVEISSPHSYSTSIGLSCTVWPLAIAPAAQKVSQPCSGFRSPAISDVETGELEQVGGILPKVKSSTSIIETRL